MRGKSVGANDPAEGDRRPEGAGRRLAAWFRTHRQLSLVYLMVASAVLSAYGIWEATNRGDTAERVLGEIEFTAALDAERESALRELIAFDLRLLPRWAATVSARDALLNAQRWEEAGIQDTERRILAGYFTLGVPDIANPAYDVEFVAGREELLSFERLSRRMSALEADARRIQSSQILLLAASVLFAACLASATFSELSTGQRLSRLWRVIALLLLGSGLVLVWSQEPVRVLLVIGAVAGLLVLLRWLIGWRDRRSTALQDSQDSRQPHRDAAWYAELFGALTVVALTVVVVLLAGALRNQREAATTAQQEHARATQILLADQQMALDDLDAAAFLEGAEARWTEGIEPEDTDLSVVHEEVLRVLREGLDGSHDQDLGGSRGDRAQQLREELASNPSFGFDHLARSARASLTEYADAALYRHEAGDWGERVAQHTLALVILGLSGYMFSLAADQVRDRLTSRWLLSAGILGFIAGMVVSLAALGSPDLPANRRAVTEAYAAGRVALNEGECRIAASRFGTALVHYADFTAAQIDRAFANYCIGEREGIYAPVVAGQDLGRFVDELEAVRDREVESELLLGVMGWGRLLIGLEDGDDSEIGQAILLTRAALARDPDNPYFLFNLGHATLASGDASAAAEAYDLAARCVLRHDDTDTEAICDGEPRDDPYSASLFALQAMADLELLSTAYAVEATGFKEQVMTHLTQSTPSEVAPNHSFDLEVFPQELQVATSDVIEGTISEVWYYRAPGERHWGVLETPTIITFADGVMNEPVLAGIALPEGDYMVEVYVNGHLIGSADSFRPDLGAHRQYNWHDLGLTAVLPRDPDWEVVESTRGLLREYRDPTDPTRGIVALRIEDWPSPTEEVTLGDDLDSLSGIVFPKLAGSKGEPTSDTYFLGLTSLDFRLYNNNTIWAAVGFSGYCESIDSPGTLWAVWIYGSEEDAAWKAPIIESLAMLEGPTNVLSAEECAPASADLATEAQDDTLEVAPEQSLTVDVLANDMLADLDPTTLLITTAPVSGVASVTAEGQILYEAAAEYRGEDSFVYEVCDSLLESCSSATVTVTIIEPGIIDLIPAPLGPECGASAQPSPRWSSVPSPLPIEVWRCDADNGSSLAIEYLRFSETADAVAWADAQIGYQQAQATDISYDGTWHREEAETALGRLFQWVSDEGGLAVAHALWVYEAEGIVGLVSDSGGDSDAVDQWWTDNA